MNEVFILTSYSFKIKVTEYVLIVQGYICKNGINLCM